MAEENAPLSPLKCDVSIPEVVGLTSQQLTVGRHFNLICRGGDTGSFDFSKAQIVTDEAHQHDFHIISATPNQSQPSITFDVVAYVTGEINTPELKITDSKNELTLQIGTVKVDSVLPPPEKTPEGTTKPPEPYGFNMANIHWPVGYTIFFTVVFCAVLSLIIMQLNRARRLRRLMLGLKDYDSAMDPDSQFYKHLRQLEKKNYPASEIEKQFHIYVIRRYQVPLFGLSHNEAHRYLKNKWPTLAKERRELKNILADLKKMTVKNNSDEVQKYLNKLYEFVDHSEEVFENHPGGRL